VVVDAHHCTSEYEFTINSTNGLVAMANAAAAGCGTSLATLTIEVQNANSPVLFSVDNSPDEEFKNQIRSRTQSRSMPLIGSLTLEEIDAFACWIDDGALDN